MEPNDSRSSLKYCPSCGEHVSPYVVRKDEAVEVRCISCGFPLRLEAGHPLHALTCIVIADDDAFFLSLLAGLLTERGLTSNVISCQSGTEFLSVAAERFRHELPIRLAILDILMEPLDGVSAGLALRALEKGLNVPQPTPLLFLSAVQADDTLRTLIGRCQPALYLNKGSDTTPEQLGPRLEKVIAYLLGQGKK